MKRIAPALYIVLGISAFTCGNVWAQATAQINGVVRDQTGAFIPGVEVRVTQIDTGLARTALSNETGAYILTNLPVGPYRLEAMIPGFRTYVQTGIVLQVGSNPTVNVLLEVGAVDQTVEVQANATLVETRSVGMGQVIENQQILELPLNGRRASDLMGLAGMAAPGVTSSLDGNGKNYPTTILSVAGNATSSGTYLLDGARHNDAHNNMLLPLPFPDALQEFKFATSALSADQGVQPGVAVNAVTKSGTNEFHGDAFEFFRDSALNARNTFALSGDGLRRNQFGGTIGGPIKTNKLFFFGGHQATFVTQTPSTFLETIPTAAMLTGDFRTFASAACQSKGNVNLLSTAGFAGNRIDPSRFSPQALNIVQHLPTTTDPCGLIKFGRKNDNSEELTIGRVDYRQSDKNTLFTRYLQARLFAPSDYDANNILAITKGDSPQHVYSAVVGDTYLIGANVVNNFRAVVNRTLNERVQKQFFDWATLGFNITALNPGNLRSDFGGFTIGTNSSNKSNFNTAGFNFSDDLGLVHGPHQIGVGGNWTHQFLNVTAAQADAQFTWDGSYSGLPLVDFMMGKPASFSQGGALNYYMRQNIVTSYITDTWTARPGVTVSMGLRWDPFLSPWEKYGRLAVFDEARFNQGLRSSVFTKAPAGMLFSGDAGMPGGNREHFSKLAQFAPRLGFGWDLTGDGKTTLRASYGLSYDYPALFTYHYSSNNQPFANLINIPYPQNFGNPWQDYPGGNPFPIAIGPNSPFQQSGTYSVSRTHIKPPYVNQWNLSLQRQIGQAWLLSANYGGNSTVHFWALQQLNPSVYIPGSSTTANTAARRRLTLANPSQGPLYAGVTQTDDGGTGNYNALLLSLQRRGKSVNVHANYTWSHCISDLWGPFEIDSSAYLVSNNRRLDRSDCDISDRRHIVNVTTVYSTPFTNGWIGKLFGAWQISGLLRSSSGQVLDLSSGADTGFIGRAGRPDQVLGDPYPAEKSRAHWLNPAAFAKPATGSVGNMSRGTPRGPGNINIDMALARTFRVRERQTFQFRAEAFNMPNLTNLLLPTTSLNSNLFGRITTASDPRILQFAVKYVF
jgi:hypothetical protein